MARQPRGLNLDPEKIDTIVHIINHWEGTLSWEDLVSVVELRLNHRYTRQALDKQPRIKAAFIKKKDEHLIKQDVKGREGSPETLLALRKADRLEEELAKAKADYAVLIEKYLRMLYHANTLGISEERLTQPLPTTYKR